MTRRHRYDNNARASKANVLKAGDDTYSHSSFQEKYEDCDISVEPFTSQPLVKGILNISSPLSKECAGNLFLLRGRRNF
jgi:hypothetical protein